MKWRYANSIFQCDSYETVLMLLSNLNVMEAGSLPWSDLFSNSIPYFLESVIVWDKLMLWLLYIKILCSGAMLLNLKLSSHPVLVWHASSLSFIYVNYVVYWRIICSWAHDHLKHAIEIYPKEYLFSVFGCVCDFSALWWIS